MMCVFCELRDSDDPRDQAVFRAITDPKFAMMAAVAVNHLMQKYHLQSVDVPINMDFTELPALMFVSSPDGAFTVSRIEAEDIDALAAAQAKPRHRLEVN